MSVDRLPQDAAPPSQVAFRRSIAAVAGMFWRGRRGPLLLGALLATLTVLFGVALLGLSGWFITATAIAGLSVATAIVFDVFAPSAGIRLFALGRTAMRYGERLVTHDATFAVLAMLRERVFRGWAAPDAARRLLLRPARLLFRLTSDIDALDSLYLRIVVPLVAAIGTALAVGVALGLLNIWFGLAAAAWLLLAGLGVPALAARRAMAPSRRRAHGLETLRQHVVDLSSGQSDLAMAGQLGAMKRRVMGADARLARADDALNKVEAGVVGAFGVASSLLLAGALVVVASLAEAGVISAPVAAFGLLVTLAALEPFAALRRGAMELGRTLLAVGRIGPRLAPQAAPAARARPAPGVAARLDNISVRRFGAAAPILEHVDLAVGVGERIAIVGPSGAGKSTLLAVLAGELEPAGGRVANLPATLLTQRTELFHDTLRANLQLAAPAADDAALMAALDAASLGEFVRQSPAGLDAVLGEGGLGLSGGQARRLALARLMLRNAPLWLLDEPTEGLDAGAARTALACVHARAAAADAGPETSARTVIIATHLRREAVGADRLIEMDGGRILASHSRGEAGYAAALAGLRPDDGDVVAVAQPSHPGPGPA